MEKKRRIKYFVVARRWFDSGPGNTYHSVRVFDTHGDCVYVNLFCYGCDEAYRQTALKGLAQNKLIPLEYRKEHLYLWERENNYPIFWTVADVQRKKDL